MSKVSISLRSNRIYLIGSCINEINGAKLPSIKQVLGYFLHLHIEKSSSIREAAISTAEKVMEFWAKAGIPTSLKGYCTAKVEKLHQKWKYLKKI